MFLSTVIALLVLQHTDAVSLPTLPPRFTAIVEANIVNKNTTWIMEEWYDQHTSRAKRVFYHDKLIMVYYEDFSNHKDQLWSYTTSHNDTSNAISCTLQSYNEANAYPISDEASSGRLASSSEWFQFGGNYSEEYLGKSFTIRGISAEGWKRNTSVNFTSPRTGWTYHQSFVVTYYFSAESWNWFGSAEKRIPIRVELRGQRLTDYGNNSISAPYDYYHIYEYVQFLENDLALDQELVFEVPLFYEQCDVSSYCNYYNETEKQICSDYKGPAMPKFAKSFSMRMEMTVVDGGNVAGVSGSATTAGEFYYDYVKDRSHIIWHGLYEGFYENAIHELLLAEHNQRWLWLGDGIGNTATSQDDVLSYCEMQQMLFNVTSLAYLVPVAGGHIVNPSRLFLFNDHSDTADPYLSTETWMGYTTVRGIPAEKWKATFNQALTTGDTSYLRQTVPSIIPSNQMIILNATIYYYFSSANWTFSYMSNESVIPLRGEIFGTYKVYNFSNSTQNYDTFVHEYALQQSFNLFDYLQQTPSDEYFGIPVSWRRDCVIDSDYCLDSEAHHADHVDEDICDAGLGLPSLPDHKYYTLIEANDMTRQQTYVIESWYNFDLNEMRNEIIFGRNKMVIYDSLDTDRRWTWMHELNNSENILSCTLSSYSSSITDNKYAETSVDGHIKSVTDLWHFGAKYNETYLGNGFVVRGINARSWHSALNSTFAINESYSVRVTGDQIYYFADDLNWNYYDLIESADIPLRVFMDLNVDASIPANGDFPAMSKGALQMNFEIVSFLSGAEAFSEAEMSFVFADWYAQCDTTAYCEQAGNDEEDICQASRGPKMPTLPFKFYVLMEGSSTFYDAEDAPSWNGTFVFEEYYDYDGNRAHAIIHNGDEWMADAYHQLDLLDKSQKWTWSGRGDSDSFGDCHLAATQSNFSGIDLMITESKGHLATPARWFRWNDSSATPPVWHGYSTVRGVTAEKWMASWSEWDEIEESLWSEAYGVQLDAQVAYYWTTQDWNTMASQWPVIPLRMELTGVTSLYNYSALDGEYNIFWMKDSFTSVYDVVVFNGQVEDAMFAAPLNWRKSCDVSAYCAAAPFANSAKECFAGPALPSWPTAFSTTIRASFVGKNYTMTMEEYFDWNGNREKIIIHPYADPEYGVEGKFINPDNPAVVNHYLEDGHVFWHWNENECVLERAKQLDNAAKSPINAWIFGGDGMDHKDEHISPTVLMFEWVGGSGGEETEFYRGTEDVGGIACDRWDSALNWTFEIGVFEMQISYYFMSADTNLMYPEYGIPVRAHIVGTTALLNGFSYPFENYYDFINFKPGKPEERQFAPPFDDDGRTCDFSLFCAQDNDLDENQNYSQIVALCDDIDEDGFVEIADLSSTKLDCKEDDSSTTIAILVVLVILLFFLGLLGGAGLYRRKVQRDKMKFEQMQDSDNANL